MGCDPEQIFRALADQLKSHVADDFNVFAWPQTNPPIPSLCVWPGEGDEFIAYFDTLGPDGLGDMMLMIRGEVGSINSESVAIKMWRLHSCGVGHPSSVVDAVMSDRTLGGVVQDAVILTSSWPVDEEQSGVAWWPVRVMFKKDGAEV